MAVIATAVLGGAGSCSPSSGAAAISRREVTALLTRHAAAVRDRQRGAFLADLDPQPRAAAFRDAQDAQFDNLRAVPLHTWRYTIGPRVTDPVALAAARRTWGTSALIVHAVLSYALRGTDAVPVRHDLWWTLVRVAGRVVIAAADALVAAGGVSWQGPWDFGPMAVVRGRSGVVLGRADQTATMRGVSLIVDTAVPVVSSVWGARWPRDVAVELPPTPAAAAAAIGTDATDSGSAASARVGDIAAVTVSAGPDPRSGALRELRVVVDPNAYAALSAAGRRIILTHEVTHVAAARATTDSTPRWLVEGLAEYVANLHSGQPLSAAAAELTARVRAGIAPARLPADAAFDRTSTGGAVAYEQAWLACRFIAARVGAAGLVRLYRLAGRATGTTTTSAAVAGAIKAVLGESLARFVAAWRAYVVARLG